MLAAPLSVAEIRVACKEMRAQAAVGVFGINVDVLNVMLRNDDFATMIMNCL